jgi:hypothetical protein
LASALFVKGPFYLKEIEVDGESWVIVVLFGIWAIIAYKVFKGYTRRWR